MNSAYDSKKLESLIQLIVQGKIKPEFYATMHYISPQSVRRWVNWDIYYIPLTIVTTCPHCNERTFVRFDIKHKMSNMEAVAGTGECESCAKISKLFIISPNEGSQQVAGCDEIWIHPAPLSEDAKVSPEIPEIYAKDFREAKLTLPISTKASVLLSRTCLQTLLHKEFGVKKGNLANEIDEVINIGKLPSHITDQIDAIRNVGNYAAHPTENTVTGELLEPTQEEAEWLIEILDVLLDFQFVQPAKLKKRRDALNQKLSEAGKKPIK